MGSTFVTLRRGADGEPVADIAAETGFWMRDCWLELWLRLLTVHLPLDHPLSQEMRLRWLVASQEGFVGCVPHDLDWLGGQPGGLELARRAVASLNAALARSDRQLSAPTLDLLGMKSPWPEDVERSRLVEIGRAFDDLLHFRLAPPASKAVMPGSAPEQGRTPR